MRLDCKSLFQMIAQMTSSNLVFFNYWGSHHQAELSCCIPSCCTSINSLQRSGSSSNMGVGGTDLDSLRRDRSVSREHDGKKVDEIAPKIAVSGLRNKFESQQVRLHSRKVHLSILALGYLELKSVDSFLRFLSFRPYTIFSSCRSVRSEIEFRSVVPLKTYWWSIKRKQVRGKGGRDYYAVAKLYQLILPLTLTRNRSSANTSKAT